MNNQELVNEAKNAIELIMAKINDPEDIKKYTTELINFLQSYCDKETLTERLTELEARVYLLENKSEKCPFPKSLKNDEKKK